MIITWSITILIIISLMLLIQRRNKNREKKIFSVIQSFAKENNSEISSYDHWYKTLIGIDSSKINRLFFIRTISDNEFKVVINLSEVKKCRFVKTERTVGNVNVIDKIDLVFSFVDNSKPDVSLEFYNTNYSQLTLSGELQLAQKWAGIVETILTTKKYAAGEVNNVKLKAPSSLNEVIVHEHTPAYSAKRKNKYAAHKANAT